MKAHWALKSQTNRHSRYIKTAIKIVNIASADSKLQQESRHDNNAADITQYLDQISVVLRAGIEYEQQEYQALLVGSQFDQDTTRFFRLMSCAF